jgi:uncharacterized protein (DUF952 family)
MTELPARIFHICSKEDWLTGQEIGSYLADSLESEGFIHCSTEEQVVRVANSMFKGKEDLLLLHITVEKLWAELRWEEAEGDVFPHIYGPINLDAVFKVERFDVGEDGTYSYPE